MRAKKLLGPLVAFALISGAATAASAQYGGFRPNGFSLIRPRPQLIASGPMVVTPSMEWNRYPRGRYDLDREENWTLNGPALDGISFISGLQNNRPIVYQRRKDDRKVPNFRADMTPQEIADMIESFYLIRGGSVSFDMTGLQPRTFMGHPGFQLDYRHLGGDEVDRQGRAVGAVINGRLYLALFDAARLHYFPAALPEFERIVASAQLRGRR
ncbi:MAG TPA: hypothetical protein VGR19_10320 [Allosphingosinicella sp.]|nr:hypothetical protein [Allosphingosinicella sp.]